MHDEIAKPDDVGWPDAGKVDFDAINDKINNRPQRSFAFDPLINQPTLTHRAQLAEKILLAFVNKLPFEMFSEVGPEKSAAAAVKQADALIAALERK